MTTKAPTCDSTDHCITCSDEGTPMRVLHTAPNGATCIDQNGARHDDIATDLIGPVKAGDQILVHAGVAIA